MTVEPGPALLAGIEHGPSLAAHRRQYGDLPAAGPRRPARPGGRVRLRGRGGAAFPFATKLEALRRGVGGRCCVVNLSEGEPASSKDAALALTRPHLVIDGAVAAARALRARELHVVLPGDRRPPPPRCAPRLAERDDPVPRALARRGTAVRRRPGQGGASSCSRAGPNLPVTELEARGGRRAPGRPTLLSNAETWARLGLLVLRGGAEYAAVGTRRRARGHPADPEPARRGPASCARRRTATGCATTCPPTRRAAGADRRLPRLVGDVGDARQRAGVRAGPARASGSRWAPASC